MLSITADVFSQERNNGYIRGLLGKHGANPTLREATEYGLGQLTPDPSPNMPLAAYFFRLSEIPNLDVAVRDFLLDTSLLCEGAATSSGYFQNFDPVEAYKKVEPLV